MFIHRFGTLAHLIAYTKLDLFKRNKSDLATSEWADRLVSMSPSNRRLTVHKGVGHNASDSEDSPPRDRKSAFRLDDVFEKRMTKLVTGRQFVCLMCSLLEQLKNLTLSLVQMINKWNECPH